MIHLTLRQLGDRGRDDFNTSPREFRLEVHGVDALTDAWSDFKARTQLTLQRWRAMQLRAALLNVRST